MQKLGEREDQEGGRPLASAPSLAVQFFLIPLAVVAVIVAVYGGFRMMLADERAPEEYLNEIRAGGRDRRWPAAYELSRLMDDPEIEVRFPDLARSLLRTFVESEILSHFAQLRSQTGCAYKGCPRPPFPHPDHL